VLAERECKTQASYPCIRCGHCLDACPVFLNPQHLGKLAAVERFDEMLAHHLNDCMLCGCCSYVCPSNIPLSSSLPPEGRHPAAAVRRMNDCSY
jgi:electron transport complex protein RnfC